MKRLVIMAVAIFAASPTMAAPLVNTNGFIVSEVNQLNQRVDQFQAASPSIPANINQMINSTQTTIGGATDTIKSINPLPSLTSPIQPFTIPAFTPVH